MRGRKSNALDFVLCEKCEKCVRNIHACHSSGRTALEVHSTARRQLFTASNWTTTGRTAAQRETALTRIFDDMLGLKKNLGQTKVVGGMSVCYTVADDGGAMETSSAAFLIDIELEQQEQSNNKRWTPGRRPWSKLHQNQRISFHFVSFHGHRQEASPIHSLAALENLFICLFVPKNIFAPNVNNQMSCKCKQTTERSN